MSGFPTYVLSISEIRYLQGEAPQVAKLTLLTRVTSGDEEDITI